MIITYTVPGKPQAWQRAAGKSGRRWTPAETKIAKKAHQVACERALKDAGWDPDAVFKLSCFFFFPPPKKHSASQGWPRDRWERALEELEPHISRPDVDNLTKLVGDALNKSDQFHGAWVDDSRVAQIEAAKWYSSNPRTEVTIEVIGHVDKS